MFAEAVKAGGAYLFFAFEHELNVAGQLVGGNHEFECLGLHKTLALVVVGTACPYLAVLDYGLEGTGAPQLYRGNRHHVVVAVDTDGGLGGVDGFLAIYYGVALGGHHFRLVAACFE